MSATSAGLKSRYFEDYIVGDEIEFGETTVDEQELLEFAQKFDPQPFHLDHEAAAQTHFGGLVTSGWHTCSMLMRMMVDHYISEVASMGSPGVDEIRWLVPVRPGDVLRARVRITEARRSNSKPDRGLVRSSIELINQNEKICMTMNSVGFFKCRNVVPG